MSQERNSLNPTNGSWWMIHESETKAELNNPPTIVGGIKTTLVF